RGAEVRRGAVEEAGGDCDEFRGGRGETGGGDSTVGDGGFADLVGSAGPVVVAIDFGRDADRDFECAGPVIVAGDGSNNPGELETTDPDATAGGDSDFVVAGNVGCGISPTGRERSN